MVLKRFWKVFGGSERVWNGFMRFEMDFAGFCTILRGFEGPGGVRESSGRVPGTVSKRFEDIEEGLRGFWRFCAGLEWF